MKPTFLILMGVFAVQSSFASTCENRERFRGPNVAFGITFWAPTPTGNESVDACKKNAVTQLGNTIDCDSTADWPQGCTVYAVDYRFTHDDGAITTGQVR